MAASNNEFARAVGVHYTMASRLRGGKRLPSLRLIRRIQKVYDLDGEALMDAYDQGPAVFSKFLRQNVFDVEVQSSVVA